MTTVFSKEKYNPGKLFNSLLVVTAFIIPLKLFPGLFIALLCVFFILSLERSYKSFFNDKRLWLVLLFFIFHVISLLYTQNMSEGLSSIEVKLSFLIFPIILVFGKPSSQNLLNVVRSYIGGCLAASLGLLLFAFYRYSSGNDSSVFYYNTFAFYMHPSYLAMYLNFALFLVLHYLIESELSGPKEKMVAGFAFFIFSVTVFLCSSKMGLITLGIIIIYFFSSLLFRSKNLIRSLIILAVSIILLVAFLFYVPEPLSRFGTLSQVWKGAQLDKTSSESSLVRHFVWQSSREIISENFFLGVGPGDVNDELINNYQKNGFTGALSKHLNAHNQYYQTWMGLGILGLLALLVQFFLLIKSAVNQRYVLPGAFAVLVGLNFLAESMLQTEAGAVFCAFFLSLFLFSEKVNFKSVKLF
jgi:O-antigen ligase